MKCASGTLNPAPQTNVWGLISTKQESIGEFYHSHFIGIYSYAHHEPVEPAICILHVYNIILNCLVFYNGSNLLLVKSL